MVQMAGSCMQLAVQDLAAMKEQGSPLEERETRLADGASQMQQLLGLLGPAAGGATQSQVGSPTMIIHKALWKLMEVLTPPQFNLWSSASACLAAVQNSSFRPQACFPFHLDTTLYQQNVQVKILFSSTLSRRRLARRVPLRDCHQDRRAVRLKMPALLAREQCRRHEGCLT